MNALLHTGLDHLDAGRSVLPVNAKKRPHAPALRSTGHVQDGTASWKILQTERPTEQMLRRWLTHPECGLGLITGRISRIVVIDADHGDGTDLFERWGLTERAHVRTKSGGLHWYIHHPGWIVKTLQSATNDRLDLIRGVDIRADGGYAVIPPTEFGEARYTSLRSHFEIDHVSMLPAEVQTLLGLDQPPPAPALPSQALSPRPNTETHTDTRAAAAGGSGGFSASSPQDDQDRRAERIYDKACDRVYEGRGRNDTGFWMAVQLRDNAVSRSQAEALLTRFVAQMPSVNTKGQAEPYTLEDALNSLRQAYRTPPRAPWDNTLRR